MPGVLLVLGYFSGTRGYLVPGVAQVVAVGVGHGDERLDGVDVLLLHLRDAGAGSQQGEPRQGLDVRVSLQLQHTP